MTPGSEPRDSFCFTWEKKKEGKKAAGGSCVEQTHFGVGRAGFGAWVWDFVPVLLTLGELQQGMDSLHFDASEVLAWTLGLSRPLFEVRGAAGSCVRVCVPAPSSGAPGAAWPVSCWSCWSLALCRLQAKNFPDLLVCVLLEIQNIVMLLPTA